MSEGERKFDAVGLRVGGGMRMGRKGRRKKEVEEKEEMGKE